MVIRAWLIAGGALIAVAWVLTVTYAPQPFQGSAASAIDEYRARGLLPEAGQLVMSKAVGHEVFEVPIRIMQPGAWMYMCMFPYHMQFGMMGVMATEGMAMDMGGMSM